MCESIKICTYHLYSFDAVVQKIFYLRNKMPIRRWIIIGTFYNKAQLTPTSNNNSNKTIQRVQKRKYTNTQWALNRACMKYSKIEHKKVVHLRKLPIHEWVWIPTLKAERKKVWITTWSHSHAFARLLSHWNKERIFCT